MRFFTTTRRGLFRSFFWLTITWIFSFLPRPACGEENILRLSDDPDSLAALLADTNWFEVLRDLAKNTGKKLRFALRNKNRQERAMFLSYARRGAGLYHPRLAFSDGTYREIRFANWAVGSPALIVVGDNGEYDKRILDFTTAHPLKVMLGAIVAILTVWLGAKIALVVIRALAYIILLALCIGILAWGAVKIAPVVIKLFRDAGFPMESFDRLQEFFRHKADELKSYLQGRMLGWGFRES